MKHSFQEGDIVIPVKVPEDTINPQFRSTLIGKPSAITKFYDGPQMYRVHGLLWPADCLDAEPLTEAKRKISIKFIEHTGAWQYASPEKYENRVAPGWLVREGVRYADGLCWDEMLGLVASMTIADGKSPCTQWLRTAEEHKAWRDRITGTDAAKGYGSPIPVEYLKGSDYDAHALHDFKKWVEQPQPTVLHAEPQRKTLGDFMLAAINGICANANVNHENTYPGWVASEALNIATAAFELYEKEGRP